MTTNPYESPQHAEDHRREERDLAFGNGLVVGVVFMAVVYLAAEGYCALIKVLLWTP